MLAVVAVAQLVESRIVIPVVVGSSPIGHPIYLQALSGFSLRLDPEYFAHLHLVCKPSHGYPAKGLTETVGWMNLPKSRLMPLP